jgi:hypothetical protein
MWLDVMLALSYLAFVTDTTRVITFEWSREAGGYGGGGENHHELSHHDGSPQKLAKLAEIDRFHLTRLERFMKLLSETEEANGRMLDRTMILYGSGMNSGTGTGTTPPRTYPFWWRVVAPSVSSTVSISPLARRSTRRSRMYC